MQVYYNIKEKFFWLLFSNFCTFSPSISRFLSLRLFQNNPTFLYEIFFAIHIPVLCHQRWQPFLGAGAPARSSALIAFQQAGQRLASHSTTLGAFQEHCAGIPLCRDLQSQWGTSKATVRLGVDDYNPPRHRFTRLLNFKSSSAGILACTFARPGHKSCPVNPGCMLGVLA